MFGNYRLPFPDSSRRLFRYYRPLFCFWWTILLGSADHLAGFFFGLLLTHFFISRLLGFIVGCRWFVGADASAVTLAVATLATVQFVGGWTIQEKWVGRFFLLIVNLVERFAFLARDAGRALDGRAGREK